MLMIRPARALSIGRVTALVIQKAPKRFVSRTSSQASSVIRMMRSSRVMPALLTRMSIWPNASSAALTTPSAVSGARASPWMASARRPSASMAARRLGRGRGVAAVGERDVGALASRAGARWPARCRASRR